MATTKPFIINKDRMFVWGRDLLSPIPMGIGDKFLARATDEHDAVKLIWTSDKSIWVDQRPSSLFFFLSLVLS